MSTKSSPMRAARVATRSVSDTVPWSMRTRPSDLRVSCCSFRAASSCSWLTRPRSSRRVPSWLLRAGIAPILSYDSLLRTHRRQKLHEEGTVQGLTVVVGEHPFQGRGPLLGG